MCTFTLHRSQGGAAVGNFKRLLVSVHPRLLVEGLVWLNAKRFIQILSNKTRPEPVTPCSSVLRDGLMEML